MNDTILCVQDLSCFGKCSLTITMPILCCADMEVIPLPTALLSTHTGGLGEPFIHDLHTDMKQIRTHWQTLSLPISVIYSGYISDHAQMHEIQALFDQYPDAYRFVDPVMGDHGSLYSSLPSDLPQAMRTLCRQAQCITPNITEAYALLEEPYQKGPYSQTEVKRILHQLHQITAADIVLKGIYENPDEIGCAVCSNDQITIHTEKRLPYFYHGTGDLFAASLLGAYQNHLNLNDAVRIAMRFTSQCMEYSHQCDNDERCGLRFEPCLSSYIDLLQHHQTAM